MVSTYVYKNMFIYICKILIENEHAHFTYLGKQVELIAYFL